MYNGSEMDFSQFEARLRDDHGDEGEGLCWVGTSASGYPAIVYRDSSLMALMSSDDFAEIAYAYAVHRGRVFSSSAEARASVPHRR